MAQVKRFLQYYLLVNQEIRHSFNMNNKGEIYPNCNSAGTSLNTNNNENKKNKKNEEDVKRFRSVLPHEALPTNETYGYVHIQGSFMPKIVMDNHYHDCNDCNDEDDKSTTGGAAPGPTTVSLPTIETLLTAMTNAFQGRTNISTAGGKCDRYGDNGHDHHSFSKNSSLPIPIPLPHTNLIKIEIEDHDDDKNVTATTAITTTSSDSTRTCCFTKARLYYPSPFIARDIVSFIRSYKLTPSILFSGTTTTSSTTVPLSYHYQFSSKAIQATQVTMNQLPPPSISWPKVGPPKFRRLLPTTSSDYNNNYNKNNNNDEEKLQYERNTTRFLFMTNIMVEKEDGEGIKNHYHDNISPYIIQDAIRNALQPYCISKESQEYPLEIYINKMNTSQQNHDSNNEYNRNKKTLLSTLKYCYVGTRSSQDVQNILTTLQGKSISLQIQNYYHYHDYDHNNNSALPYHPSSSSTIIINTGKLFFDYAAITQRCEAKLKLKHNSDKGEPTRPECTSVTDSIHVPGLQIIPDFLSTDEEETILAVLKGPNAPWAPSQRNFSKTGSVKRRVQHYGYVFDYETANVLRDRNDGVLVDENDENSAACCCPPLPSLPDNHGKKGGSEWSLEELMEYNGKAINEGRGWDVLAATIERVRRYEFNISDIQNKDCDTKNHDVYNSCSVTKYPSLNQMTVNEYKRGEGIGSHIDTKSAFADGLISISLGADCVMEFKEQATGVKKLVHLPPRSLLLMSGPSRYCWEHMIVSRSTDVVNGKLIPRKTRTSLTLRTAITLPDTNNKVKPLDIVESNIFPPCWGNQKKGDLSDIATPDTEKQHVHAVYDAIAKQWHHTRGKRGTLWPGATSFLKGLPRGSVVADVGCGDGKYFPAIWQAGSYVIGTDISLPLLETSVGSCQEEGEEGPELRKVSKQNYSFNSRPSVAVADCMQIPLRSGSCDAAICIAVMHHLSTRPRRIRCLKELARIVKTGGTVNVQAWAFEQENNSKRKFAGTDVFVPFNSQPRYLDKVSQDTKHQVQANKSKDNVQTKSNSVAEMYSDAYDGAEYDDTKGLVVFQRYCHMYREGELESLCADVDNLEVLESGFETGNHFVIFKVV